MLNYNKIHSCINDKNISVLRLSKEIGLPNSTLTGRINNKNLNADDIEKIAEYFGKSIGYFFDKEEISSEGYETIKNTNEMLQKENRTLREAIENEKKLKKEVEDLTKELLDITRKYSKLLEVQSEKRKVI